MVKNLLGQAGDVGLIPGSERSLGVGNGNQLQYSYLENSMERGAWWAIVQWGHKESDTAEHTRTHVHVADKQHCGSFR